MDEINAWIAETSTSTPLSASELTSLAAEYPDLGFLQFVATCWLTGWSFPAHMLFEMYHDASSVNPSHS